MFSIWKIGGVFSPINFNYHGAIPAREGGEDVIVAFVVLQRQEQLDDDSLRVWINRSMPKFMWPSIIRTVSSLPRTPTNKVENSN
ncbi:AMP-binding enzyme [Geomicrobium halophilum]|uniref:AMP-binding enzyme n=1 Tax=Geomicrobium halophilum TaxID=549000 RepID=UPI00161A2E66